MNKCSFCDKKYSNDAVTQILVKGMDFCTAEPDDVEISNKHVCASCLAASVNYPNEAKYGLCGLDTEQSYALHASDLIFYMDQFYCREHISEMIMDEEEVDGWGSLADYYNKD